MVSRVSSWRFWTAVPRGLHRSGAPPCLRSRKDQGNPGCTALAPMSRRRRGGPRIQPRRVSQVVGLPLQASLGKGCILTSA